MQITPAQLKTTFSPYQAESGRNLDVAAMKAAQGQIPDRVASAMDWLARAPAESSIPTLDEVYKSLISGAEEAGGAIGHITVDDLKRGHAALKKEAAINEAAGFTRLVTPAQTNLYNAAKNGSLRPISFGSKAEAAEFALAALEQFRGYADQINRYGEGDPTVGGPFRGMTSSADAQDPVIAALNARKHDSIEAGRMRLFIEAAELSKVFGIEGPIYEVENGRLRINTFDIHYEGEAIVRSTGGGGAAPYSADGSLAFDRYI